MNIRLPNFNKMSTAKLAFFVLCAVLMIFVIAVTLIVQAPQVASVIGVIIMIAAMLSVVYGFCYAIIKDFRGGNW